MARNKTSKVKSSVRTKVKYPVTKSDPLCKWRTAKIETVVELVSLLPKTRLSKDRFRDHMAKCYDGAFFRTPYQLASQLGLYYEDENEFIPRFDHNITKEEATVYMHKWMQRYYVPNPFTKNGFVNIYPSVNLLNGLVEYLENHPSKSSLVTAGAALFGGEIGNIGSVKYVLNEYSNIIKVDSDNNMSLLVNRGGSVDVMNHRDDKKAFFEHFND